MYVREHRNTLGTTKENKDNYVEIICVLTTCKLSASQPHEGYLRRNIL
jgi:hypothetical protein